MSRKIKYSSSMIGEQTNPRKYNSPRLVDKVAKDPEIFERTSKNKEKSSEVKIVRE